MRKEGLFVSLVFSFGATIEDLRLDAFLNDPTKISNSLRTINTFFESDGTVCCGNEPMLKERMIEGMKRIRDIFTQYGV